MAHRLAALLMGAVVFYAPADARDVNASRGTTTRGNAATHSSSSTAKHLARQTTRPRASIGNKNKTQQPAGHSATARSRSRSTPTAAKSVSHKTPPAVLAPAKASQAEARLLDIYRLIGSGQMRQALNQAQGLVDDVPNFQLAQLVYADLLSAQTAPLRSFGAAPGHITSFAPPDRLSQLREEATRRIQALRERPPAGAIPKQLIELPRSSQHAIAVDASRSRLYLFGNSDQGLRLLADHYVSLGRLGIEKSVEGDQRTPVGVYFVTSRLDGKKLTDFYGTGALPINYPNEYDKRLGRTGNGIWLHGVPRENFARSPNATDGCVVLSNPDLESLLEQVEPRSTPVLISPRLEWVPPTDLAATRERARNLLEGWRLARTSGDINRTLSFYSPQFQPGTTDPAKWRQATELDVARLKGRSTQIKDLSILSWRDKNEIMVITFGEVLAGQRTGPIKRQYWSQENGLWKIIYEGVIG